MKRDIDLFCGMLERAGMDYGHPTPLFNTGRSVQILLETNNCLDVTLQAEFGANGELLSFYLKSIVAVWKRKKKDKE